MSDTVEVKPIMQDFVDIGFFNNQRCKHCGQYLVWSSAFNMPLCPNPNCPGKVVTWTDHSEISKNEIKRCP